MSGVEYQRAFTAVNQFHSGTAVGDAVTGDMLAMQRALTQAGFQSRIFAEHVTPALQDRIERLDGYNGDPDSLLIVHHSFGINCLERVLQLPDRKILKYHNITPPHLLSNPHLKAYAELGREQLAAYRQAVEIALGDSDYNRRELVEMGFRYTETLPIFYTPSTLIGESPDKSVTRGLRSSFNVLFVGRLCPNKSQLELVRIFHRYLEEGEPSARLFLVGSADGCEEYLAEIRDEIARLRLTEAVVLPGKVSNAELAAYYRGCDVLACVSEHEGFCVPLLEAMSFELPVVAYAAAAVPETLGGAGILLDSRNPELWSQVFHELRTNQQFKTEVIAGQRRRLDSFRIEDSGRKLLEIIGGLGCSAPTDSSRPTLQIQGPFETSYSLALINRHLAEALDLASPEFDTSIYCTEGPGDYPPNQEELKRLPHARWLWQKSSMLNGAPEVVIRNLYPPRVHDVPGARNFLYFFWEDSLIPRDWAESFNRSLDGVLSPTRFVEKVLRDSGVNIPIHIVGAGVAERFFSSWPVAKPRLGSKSFAFLSVGSGFPRKGIDVLLRAYFEEFTDDDDVCLILKTFPNIHNDIAQQLARRRGVTSNPPEVIHIDLDLPQDELDALYDSANCLVHPARGEGFGLPIAEAMARRLPTIVSAYGGHLDFCSSETSFLVPCTLEASQSHLNVPNAVWAEPDLATLREHMRFVFEHHDGSEVQGKVERAYTNIEQNFRWANVAQRVQDAIDAKIPHPRTKLAMVTTWDAKCGIAEYSRYFIEGIREASPDLDTEVLASPGDAVWPPMDVPSTVCWDLRPARDLSGLRGAVLRNGYEIVHFQFNFGFFELDELGLTISELKRAGKRVVITFHSTADLVQDNRLITLRSIAGSLRQADLLLVHSEVDRERLARFGLSENLELLPHGNVVFPQMRSGLRTEWSIPFDPVIGTFGFLLPHKGLLELLEAVTILQRDYPNIGLMAQSALHRDPISASFEQVVRRRIDELQMRERVLLSTEFVEPAEASVFLQLTDCIVLPYQSSAESSSAAVRFALGAGRPVITTASAIFSDVAECTYQIPSNEPQEVATAIKDVFTDPALAHSLSLRARAYTEAASWARVGRLYLQMLERSAQRSMSAVPLEATPAG